MACAALVIAVDFTAVNIALPSIEADFGTDLDSVQWVVNAYTLVFGVLIVSAGRAADLFGRRRSFVAGALVFGSMSVVAAAAGTEGVLIGARAVMGVGAAVMWPAMVAMTYALLPGRGGLAGGIVAGTGGLGNAIGPLLGGALTDLASWRWVFLLNIPIALFAIAATLATVRLREPAVVERRLDLGGSLTLSAAALTLLVAVGQVDSWGWGDARVLALLAVSLVSLLAFVAVERRQGGAALLPPALLANRAFLSACVALLFLSGTFFASLLYLPEVMQRQLGFSPLEAGFGMLPQLATFGLVSFLVGPLYARWGARPLALLGAACLCLGPLQLSFITADWGYPQLLAGMVLIGIGIGAILPTATTAGIEAVAPDRAGLAGGVLFMFQIGGGAIGLGLTTTVFSAVAPTFADGAGAAFGFDAALSLVGLAVAALWIGRRA